MNKKSRRLVLLCDLLETVVSPLRPARSYKSGAAFKASARKNSAHSPLENPKLEGRKPSPIRSLRGPNTKGTGSEVLLLKASTRRDSRSSNAREVSRRHSSFPQDSQFCGKVGGEGGRNSALEWGERAERIRANRYRRRTFGAKSPSERERPAERLDRIRSRIHFGRKETTKILVETTCAHCQSEFECDESHIKSCHCAAIPPASDDQSFASESTQGGTAITMGGSYGGCVCPNCLVELERKQSFFEDRSSISD